MIKKIFKARLEGTCDVEDLNFKGRYGFFVPKTDQEGINTRNRNIQGNINLGSSYFEMGLIWEFVGDPHGTKPRTPNIAKAPEYYKKASDHKNLFAIFRIQALQRKHPNDPNIFSNYSKAIKTTLPIDYDVKDEKEMREMFKLSCNKNKSFKASDRDIFFNKAGVHLLPTDDKQIQAIFDNAKKGIKEDELMLGLIYHMCPHRSVISTFQPDPAKAREW